MKEGSLKIPLQCVRRTVLWYSTFLFFSLRWQYRGEGNSIVVVLAIILVLIVSAGLFYNPGVNSTHLNSKLIFLSYYNLPVGDNGC